VAKAVVRETAAEAAHDRLEAAHAAQARQCGSAHNVRALPRLHPYQCPKHNLYTGSLQICLGRR